MTADLYFGSDLILAGHVFRSRSFAETFRSGGFAVDIVDQKSGCNDHGDSDHVCL